MPRISGRRLAITTTALAAVVAGGAVAAVVVATSGHNTPPPSAPSAPALPGIPASALAAFNLRLQTPDGHGAARITAGQARTVALPLGEGSQSDGWSIVGSPVLTFVDYTASATATRTCLCWAVELNSSHAIPCDGAAGAAASQGLCENHHLVELIDAANGGRWLSVSGHGLG